MPHPGGGLQRSRYRGDQERTERSVTYRGPPQFSITEAAKRTMTNTKGLLCFVRYFWPRLTARYSEKSLAHETTNVKMPRRALSVRRLTLPRSSIRGITRKYTLIRLMQ